MTQPDIMAGIRPRTATQITVQSTSDNQRKMRGLWLLQGHLPRTSRDLNINPLSYLGFVLYITNVLPSATAAPNYRYHIRNARLNHAALEPRLQELPVEERAPQD